MPSTVEESTNYRLVAPLSMMFAFLAVIISIIILMLVCTTKQLHTVTHCLICNTCISSILYCVVQCINYIYLLFIPWETSDESCRWRGYFGYMSIVAIVYSYLLQAVSRYFIAILSMQYRWLVSIKITVYLIVMGWICVILVPLPALLTKDIYFRKGFLCWVPRTSMLHIIYTIFAYYAVPIAFIVCIYGWLYIRIHYLLNNVAIQVTQRRKNRDLEVFRNLVILLGIYILGAVPSGLYALTNVEIFYAISIVTLSMCVTVEKLVSLYIDRDIRHVCKKVFCRFKPQIAPYVAQVPLPQ